MAKPSRLHRGFCQGLMAPKNAIDGGRSIKVIAPFPTAEPDAGCHNIHHNTRCGTCCAILALGQPAHHHADSGTSLFYTVLYGRPATITSKAAAFLVVTTFTRSSWFPHIPSFWAGPRPAASPDDQMASPPELVKDTRLRLFLLLTAEAPFRCSPCTGCLAGPWRGTGARGEV